MPSMLAALGRPMPSGRRWSLKWMRVPSASRFSIRNNCCSSARSKMFAAVTITGDQLAEEVYPSVVFFQDTYNLNIERVYVAGFAGSRRGGARAQKSIGGASRGTGTSVADRFDDRHRSALENGGRGGSADFVIDFGSCEHQFCEGRKLRTVS